MLEHYAALYTSQRFWSLSVPDFDSNHLDFIQKMCETVKEYNFEEGKIKLKICKDGMFMIKHDDLENEINCLQNQQSMQAFIDSKTIYIDWLNTIYLVFVSSFIREYINKTSTYFVYFDLSDITWRDVIRITFKDNEFLSAGNNQAIGASYINHRFSVSSYYDITLKEKDERVIIDETTFETLYNQLEIIFKNTNNIKILSNLLKSIGEFKIGNFSLSLILSWFIIETYLNSYWTSYLENLRVSPKRIKYLTNNDYTAAIISNILELVGVFNSTDFEMLDSIRKERNAIVHKSKNTTDRKLCVSAFQVIEKFFNEQTGASIIVDHSLKF